MTVVNPFITQGYLSPRYFCDRVEITSRPFLQRHHLTASTVQGAVKGLLEKDLITQDLGTYSVYDNFFAMWLMQQ